MNWKDTITIIEVPNSWGWYGALDRTTYEVRIGEEVWTRLCYRAMAEKCVERLLKEPFPVMGTTPA